VNDDRQRDDGKCRQKDGLKKSHGYAKSETLSAGARSAYEEPREHLLVVLIERHGMKIHGRLQHDLAKGALIGSQRLVVQIRDVVRLGKDSRSRLHIEEAHRSAKVEGQF